jgi:hypothetical protein
VLLQGCLEFLELLVVEEVHLVPVALGEPFLVVQVV